MRSQSGILFWVSLGFVALFSAYMLWYRPVGWAPFYSFLPMAFFSIGVALIEVIKRIRGLEERIRVLEGKP